MSTEDRRRWDEKWQEHLGPAPPSELLQRYAPLMSGGLALDVACGLGQNTLWLARQGYSALGIDVSYVALQRATSRARRQGLQRRTLFAQIDLDHWQAPAECVDLVCVFRFLDRRLWPIIGRILRPGGFLFYETRHKGVLARRPEATPAYLLRPGELRSVFGDWQILKHEEAAENARLVARRRP